MSIFDVSTSRFEFRPGPIFAHVLLADEINRTSPKVQSAMLEAMAGGLPVVATRHGGIPEAVEHGVSGLLTAERDAPALAQSLSALARDPACYAAMSAASSARVAAEFSLSTQARVLEAIYREVAAAT